MRDDEVRAALFAALDVLQARCGPDLPWDELRRGFNFRGRRIPFMNRGYGIYRAKDARRGPAALSISSSFAQRRYQDEQTPDGVLYRYQDGPIDNHFNIWLRQAHALRVPLAYFIGAPARLVQARVPGLDHRGRPGDATRAGDVRKDERAVRRARTG
jgi:hypothetical protein